MDSLFEDYLAYSAGVRHFSPYTIESYRNDLKLFSSWLAENELTCTAVTKMQLRIFIADMGNRHLLRQVSTVLFLVCGGFTAIFSGKGLFPKIRQLQSAISNSPKNCRAFSFLMKQTGFANFPRKLGYCGMPAMQPFFHHCILPAAVSLNNKRSLCRT